MMTSPPVVRLDHILAEAGDRLTRGRVDEAIALCRRILQALPEQPDALHMLAIAANRNGKAERALEIASRALTARPCDPAIENTLGLVLAKLGRLDEAEARFRSSCAHPNALREAWLNLSGLKARAGLPEEALEVLGDCERRFGADKASALSHAEILQLQGRFEAATRVLEVAKERSPDDIDIGFALANVLLLQGRFAEGWPGFEMRRARALGRKTPVDRPLWDGSRGAGQRLLVYAEHGLGDVIQFGRYIPHLSDLGLDVTFACYPALLPLMRSLRTAHGLVADNGALPPCDWVVPIMSLPRILGHGLAEISALGTDSPYLSVKASDVAWVKAALREVRGFRVGVAWQGNPSHSDDSERSIPLAAFEPLMACQGVATVSLQVGSAARAMDPYKTRYRIEDRAELKRGLYPTACLMRALDLVVTCDTAIAHLGGALGVPTWLALAAKPSWRWMLGRDDSPWYPSVRLFRQETAGDWSPPFRAMRRDLARLAGGPNA